MFKRCSILLSVLLLSVSQGAITFVDADLGNTTVNGAALVDGVNYSDGSNSIADDLWGTRSRASVNGGFVWTTDAPASSVYSETTEPLVTTMTISNPGEYRIFGMFYISQQGTSLWDCSFSMDGQTYITYTKDNASVADAAFFDAPVLVADVDGTSYLFVVQIGTVTTTEAGQEVSVYVQGEDFGDTDSRSWFEGIGYQPSSEAALLPEPVEYPDEPDIQPGSSYDVTLNKKDTGFRGVWYYISYSGDAGEYVYKYSGGLGTYCTRHRPLAVYRPEVDKTFFCYGGTSASSNEQLWHMVSSYDHQSGEVAMPTLLLDKRTNDAHDNPVMSTDGDGRIWIFSTSHGTGRESYIHKSKIPYDIDEFELVESTKVDSGGNVVPFTNFSYFQPWSDGADGFSAFLTIYNDPVERTIQFMNTTDGVNWSQAQKISIAGRGAYQMSGQYQNKLVTAFNFHPQDGQSEPGRIGVDSRTNLYLVQTLDNGATWQTIDGTPVTLPMTDSNYMTTPMLVRDYITGGHRNVYLNDLVFDASGNPVITYITTDTAQPGPDGGPRYWEIARWDGTQWIFSTIGEVDHGFDGGSLYIEPDGTWRVIGAFVGGPQPYGTGGEMEMYTSSDQGLTWTKVMDVTSGSIYNHTHIRRPLNAKEDFYGFWADGHSREPSESNIYYCDKAGNVTQLPRGTGPAPDACEMLVPVDIDHDCEVNFKDYTLFAANWLAEGNNLPTDFSQEVVSYDPISESFEVDNIAQLPYNYIGNSPTFSTAQAYEGSKSMYWASSPGDLAICEMLPFAGDSVSGCSVSIQVYIGQEAGQGRIFLAVYDESENWVWIALDKDLAGAEGEFDVLCYRQPATSGTGWTRDLHNVGPGWHELKLVVNADNSVDVYFDGNNFTSTVTLTGGLKKIRWGKPMTYESECDVYFDSLEIIPDSPVEFTGDNIDDSFELSSINDIDYTLSGTAAELSTDVAFSGEKSVYWASGDCGVYIVEPFDGISMSNATVSTQIYLPDTTGSGRAYLSVMDAFSNPVMLIADRDSSGAYDILYRIGGSYTRPIEDVGSGWHQFSFVVHNNNAVGVYFDDQYLTTATNFNSGLTSVKFGKPWGDYPDLAVYYDDLKITYDTDVIGNGTSSIDDIYEDFEYAGEDGFGNIGGYAYSGNPTFSDVIQRSGKQVVCTADRNSTKMTKTLPETKFNCRVSAWIYVPYINSGQGYLRATGPDGEYAFIGVNPNPDRTYYRFVTDSYAGSEIEKGWHLMSIIVDYQGYFHLFFDNNYLDTYTDSSGLSEISFGNPWSTAGYVAYDSLTVIDDIRGGFIGDWNTVYKVGDHNQDGINNSEDLDTMAESWLINP